MLENKWDLLEWRVREYDGNLSVHLRRWFPANRFKVSLRGYKRVRPWEWWV